MKKKGAVRIRKIDKIVGFVIWSSIVFLLIYSFFPENSRDFLYFGFIIELILIYYYMRYNTLMAAKK